MIELNSDGVVATRFGVNAGGVVSGQLGPVEVDVGGDGTTDVCAETATPEPPEFEAVTTTRRVAPTSAVVTA
jgi:hypothetical protein